MSAYHGRVLVVDDFPDVRVTLSGLLSDEGYQVRSASSRAEALHLLDAERFHVAILDVRLDESDAANHEGLQLMHEINEIDPTVAIILLTGYATVRMVQEALQPGPDGRSPAFDFLEKNEMEHLLERVERAFEHIGLDPTLEIQDIDNSLQDLSRKIVFINTKKPSQYQFEEEAEELLRKLFLGYKQIQIRSMRRGYSSVAVFEIIPWHRENEQGEPLIAKIGAPALIEKEASRYRQDVRGMIGEHRLPTALEVKWTRSLAGILYTFAGLGHAVEFADFYARASTAEILSVIENLYLETCFPRRTHNAVSCRQADLRTVFMPLLRLDEKKLQTCLHKTLGGRHSFNIGEDAPDFLVFDKGISLLNPVLFALSADLHADYTETTIHGDLHGHNILVDRRHEAWLIDFANVCKGPLLQDYVALENFLRVSLVECSAWDILQTWEHALFNSTDLCHIALPESIAQNPVISKAHEAVLKIRQLAFHYPLCDTKRTYLVGLLFNALKAFTVMDLPALQRDHALLSAALIAERLSAMHTG
ncbi:MAG: response regulator [Anaerolineae bacterium]|nr:response regulator [Anaerolineae bacterium]